MTTNPRVLARVAQHAMRAETALLLTVLATPEVKRALDAGEIVHAVTRAFLPPAAAEVLEGHLQAVLPNSTSRRFLFVDATITRSPAPGLDGMECVRLVAHWRRRPGAPS